MKKNLFKLLAVMLCLCLAFTACSKDESDEDEGRGRRRVTEAPEDDKPTEAVTDVPDGNEPDVTSTPVPDVNVADVTAVPEVTAEPTAEPTVEPTAEPTPEPTAEPTAEPTPEPGMIKDIVIEPVKVADVPADGREFTREDMVALAAQLSNVHIYDKEYTYMDIEMNMDSMGQSMNVIMTETLYKYYNTQHSITNTNLFGSNMVIDTYSVTENNETVSYVSYDGGATWMKEGALEANSDVLLADDLDKFAETFKNGWIVETTSGYTVTGDMNIPYEEELMVPLTCEFYLDTNGIVTGYKMNLLDEVEVEEDGIKMLITKFDMEFENDCPEIEIPAEALNAGEPTVEDYESILGGLGLDEILGSDVVEE